MTRSTPQVPAMPCNARTRTVRLATLAALALALTLTGSPAAAQDEPAETVEVPVLDGDWWRIAPNAPDVGEWSTGDENACDFTVYRDAEGGWHLVSCIRGTSHHGQRLFYQWRADGLSDSPWEPVGILEVRRGMRGRPPQFSSAQAPHAFWHEGRCYMFYNSAGAHCLLSEDGLAWRQHVNAAGQEHFFPMGRDVCVFHDEANGRWIAYYCGTATVDGERRGAMVARTAPTPEGPWSDREVPVRTTGNPESPFVLRRGDHYYLWQQMRVFRSDDPLDFDDAELVNHMTGLWYSGRFAPEVIEHEGQWYIAGYSRGIWLAKMRWVEKTPQEVAAWRAGWDAYYAEEMRQLRERRRRRAEHQAEQERESPTDR